MALRQIHLNVHIEFDPGMVKKGVLVCCVTSLHKWSIDKVSSCFETSFRLSEWIRHCVHCVKDRKKAGSQ